jgi:prophage regulatory protein
MDISTTAVRRALLRKSTVLSVLGDSNTQLYEKINRGLVTRGIKIGDRAVAWPSDEVEAIITARIAGTSESDMRALVERLHAARREVAQ